MVSHQVGLSSGDGRIKRNCNDYWLGLTCMDIRSEKSGGSKTGGEYWLFVEWKIGLLNESVVSHCWIVKWRWMN